MNYELTTPSSCACDRCVACCKSSPCIPTPQEAINLVMAGMAGYASKIDLKMWASPRHGFGPEIFVGPKGVLNPDGITMTCVFLKNDQCTLHASGLKPLEGQLVHHSQTDDPDLRRKWFIDKYWNTDLGREVISRFGGDHPAFQLQIKQVKLALSLKKLYSGDGNKNS